MNTSTNRTTWAARILTALAVFAFLPGGIMKLSHHPTVVEGFSRSNIPEGAIFFIGIVELACLAFFLVPRTTVLGTLLLTGYLGGATLANIINRSDFIHALVVGVLVWAAAWIRVPEFRALVPLRKSAHHPASVFNPAVVAPYRAVSRVAAIVLCLSAVVSAAGLTDEEKQAGLAQLNRTRNAVIDATKGLSEAQWKFKPAPGRWSVAEVVEHIALTEDLLLKNTSEKVMQAPAGQPDRDYKTIDKLVVSVIADRTNKVQAPEPLLPVSRWTPQQALDQFLKARVRTIEFLKKTSGLRDHVVDSPLKQPLDAYQWLLYSSAHSERHTRQILEVKADPNFPKN
jgi:hypothetical protein